MITVEEGSIGGFASHVLQFLALDGLLDGNLKVKWLIFYWALRFLAILLIQFIVKVRPLTLPDRPIEHGVAPKHSTLWVTISSVYSHLEVKSPCHIFLSLAFGAFEMQLLEAGLSSSQIASSALSLLGKTSFKLDVD